MILFLYNHNLRLFLRSWYNIIIRLNTEVLSVSLNSVVSLLQIFLVIFLLVQVLVALLLVPVPVALLLVPVLVLVLVTNLRIPWGPQPVAKLQRPKPRNPKQRSPHSEQTATLSHRWMALAEMTKIMGSPTRPIKDWFQQIIAPWEAARVELTSRDAGKVITL